MDEAELRRWRHDLRGHLNALKLSLTVLGLVQDPAEIVEMLDQIIRECDDISGAMEVLEQMEDPPAAASSPG